MSSVTSRGVDTVLRYRNAAYLFSVLLVAVGFPLAYLNNPLHVDESLYLVFGGKINRGALLYTEVIDHKPPAVYYLAAIISRLAGEPYVALRILTYGVTALSGLALLWLGAQLRDVSTGMIASLLFLIGTYVPHYDGFVFMTEQYAVLSTIVAAGLLLTGEERWRYPLVGTSLAVGVLFNQTVFLFGAAIVAVAALRLWHPAHRTRPAVRRTVVRILLIGVGFAIPVALVLGYFAQTGQLADVLRYTLYVPLTQYDPPFDVKGHLYSAAAFLPVWVLSASMVGRTAVSWYRRRVDETSLFLSVWLVFLSYPGVTSFVGDHKMLFTFPAASLLAAFALRSAPVRDQVETAVEGVRERGLSRSHLRTWAILAVAVGLIVASLGFNAVYASLVVPDSVNEQRGKVAQLDAQIDGVVYTFPFNNEIPYFGENIRAPNTYLGAVYSESLARQVVADLERQRVSYVVVPKSQVNDQDQIDPSGYFPESAAIVAEYVNEAYEPAGTTDEFVVYRRT